MLIKKRVNKLHIVKQILHAILAEKWNHSLSLRLYSYKWRFVKYYIPLTDHPLRKTPKFHLISWSKNFVETHSFRWGSGDSRDFVLGNQWFPVRVWLLAMCRGELSAVIAQLASKGLWNGWKWQKGVRDIVSLFLCCPMNRECSWKKIQIKKYMYIIPLPWI